MKYYVKCLTALLVLAMVMTAAPPAYATYVGEYTYPTSSAEVVRYLYTGNSSRNVIFSPPSGYCAHITSIDNLKFGVTFSDYNNNGATVTFNAPGYNRIFQNDARVVPNGTPYPDIYPTPIWAGTGFSSITPRNHTQTSSTRNKADMWQYPAYYREIVENFGFTVNPGYMFQTWQVTSSIYPESSSNASSFSGAVTYKRYSLTPQETSFGNSNGHVQINCNMTDTPFTMYYRAHNVTTGVVSPWFTSSWVDEATTGGNQYTYNIDYCFYPYDLNSYSSPGCPNPYYKSWDNVNIGSVTLDTQPPSGTISAPANNKSTTVTLTLAGTDNIGVTQMRFKTDSGTWSAWETYSSQKSLNVASEGNHTVYVEYKDAMNNVSTGSVSTSFNVDITSPTGTISLNSGSTFVGNTADLVLSASDNNAVDKMIISDNSLFTGAGWQDYDGSYSLAVTGGDGSKTLYVKYRDPAGNESPVYSLAVTKDTVAPENCTMTLQGLEGIIGETKSQSITVVATGSDANGVAGIQVSNDSSSWSPMCTTKVGDEFQLTNYLLTEGRGIKTVYVRVYDAAGNFTLLSDTIRYDEDTTLPSCSIDLLSPAGSSAYTVDPAITVKITANDNATFTSDLQYRLSNNGLLWSSYATFSPVVTWNLVTDAGGSTTEGTRTVYINVKDAAGNVGYATATIAYSATRPESNTTPLQQLVNNSTDPNVNVTVGIYDGKEVIFATNNVVYMPISMDASTSQIRYSIDGSDFGEWLPYNTASSQKINLGRGEGLVEVRYQGKNLSGAVSDAYTINFLYDYTPPVIRKLEGLKGATATKTGSITLLAEVSDNLSQIINYRYQIDSGAWSSLTALGPAGASNNFSVSGIVAGINVVGMEFQDVNGNIATGSLNIFGL